MIRPTIPPARPKKNMITIRPSRPPTGAAYQISVFSAQRIAITTATATIVQKIAITKPISELDRQRNGNDQDDAREEPFLRIGGRAGRSSSSVRMTYSVPRRTDGPDGPPGFATASVVDALEVLEARSAGSVARPSKPQPGEPVAAHRERRPGRRTRRGGRRRAGPSMM